ncbi:hypothetical protein NDU88_000077 [Pleurodeles waltl]|uniref:Uncharacterized protein n=1 Tax=Pleurodeles waltl TaxID=8319 RepID=A0AAV7S5Y4_PLEWA|nr:hypothetical protein NDU88_000077 [Pleurodeles waltl]
MGTLPTGAHQAGALSAPSARQFKSLGGQLPIPSPLRDRATSLCGRADVLGRLASARGESARLSSATEAVVAPSGPGRSHCSAAADPLLQKAGRAQRWPPFWI